MSKNHASLPRPSESAEEKAARISSRSNRNTTLMLSISGVLAAAISVGVPLLVNRTSGDGGGSAESASISEAESSEAPSPSPGTAPEESEGEESEATEASVTVEARYKGVTLVLAQPDFGYQTAQLIDFDGDEPSVADGAAVDYPERDMFYDHQFQDEASAFFRVNTEGGAMLGVGPNALPEDPADCEAAIEAEPMEKQLPQPAKPLSVGSGYCLRTNEGSIVWFEVVSRTGEERNYRFEFLVTMWPKA
jgi:hypothetical protein